MSSQDALVAPGATRDHAHDVGLALVVQLLPAIVVAPSSGVSRPTSILRALLLPSRVKVQRVGKSQVDGFDRIAVLRPPKEKPRLRLMTKAGKVHWVEIHASAKQSAGK